MLAEGPAALMHRIVDLMVDNYRPEVEKIEERIDEIERAVFDRNHRRRTSRAHPRAEARGHVAAPRGRAPARRRRRASPAASSVEIDEAVAYRFRDVYDHLVRIADEAMVFHDRLTGLLDAHLSSMSNRMNEVMKVLTVITTIFGPLTVIVGLFGMNVHLPAFPGGERRAVLLDHRR